MPLRLKIVLGVLIVPALTAVVLLLVAASTLSQATRRAEEAKRMNAERLKEDAESRSRELDKLLLETAATWIDANTWDARDDLTLNQRLLESRLFRRRARFHPESLQDGKGPARDDDVIIVGASLDDGGEYAASGDDAAMLQEALADGRLKGRRNVVYWPYRRMSGGPVVWVFRLEMAAAPPNVPDLEEAALDLGPLFRTAAWTMSVGTALLVIALLFLVRRFVLNPMRGLIEGSRRVARGDYSLPLPEPAGQDEMARLIRVFNQMQGDIRSYQAEMEARIDMAAAHIREQERSLIIAQRLAATGTMAAGLAHEINNPLGGMKNAARRLNKSLADPRAREYLALIDEGLERIQGLMRQILDFSRRRDTKPEFFELQPVLRRALGLIHYRFDSGAVLVADLPAAPIYGFGDAASLEQVIVNLALNARDALRDGKGEVRVSLAENQENVVLCVTDNGIGMDEATRARIFDPFFSTKETGKGTGLGLSIVHTIVGNHQGRIEVESKPEHGTTFRVLLPRVEEVDNDEVPNPSVS